MTIQKAIQLLCSSDDKYQAMGAYYLQHTCFQDESAKQEVSKLLQSSAVTLDVMAHERDETGFPQWQGSIGPFDFRDGALDLISHTQGLI